MSLNNGDVFAGYTIVKRLGSAGMGEVYLAQHHDSPAGTPSRSYRPR
jgi:serine/threonine-protein kinase